MLPVRWPGVGRPPEPHAASLIPEVRFQQLQCSVVGTTLQEQADRCMYSVRAPNMTYLVTRHKEILRVCKYLDSGRIQRYTCELVPLPISRSKSALEVR